MQDRDGRRLRLAASATRYLRSNKTLALVLARPDNKVETLVDAHPGVRPENTAARA
jgi:lambda repressor-like predicted transcriptional regulator